MLATSKNALKRQIEIFLANAADPDIQVVLEQSGCNADYLGQGQQLMQTWWDSEVRAGVLNGEKREATKVQNKALKAAHREIAWLTRMIRGEFGRNDVVLTKLGLQTRARAASNGHHPDTNESEAAANGQYTPSAAPLETSNGNGKKRLGRNDSASLSAVVARGQRLCAAIATLNEDERNKLAIVGWDAERIQETAAMVEAVAEADNAQHRAIQVKRAAVAEAQNNRKRLERWFQRAVRMAKEAVDRHDRHDRESWLTRLGL